MPPPVVALACASLMYAAAKLLPQWRWDVPHSAWLGMAVALCGITIDSLALVSFFRAHTTVNPLTPDRTSTLVRSGIYRVTRNPMYVGLLLVLTGFALYLAHPVALLGLPLFVLYLTRFQIIPEERILTARFGAQYLDFMAQVRRWL